MSLLLLLGGGGSDPTDHPGTADFPGITVQIAFGYTWRDESPSWTDVTQHVHWPAGISISEGRSDELQPFDAATCTYQLDCKDRTYDPSYEDGPWFGLLEPLTPTRVVAHYAGTNYPLFYGFVEGFPVTSEVGNRQSWTNITANDGLEMLAQADYSGGGWTLDDPVLGLLDAGNRVGGGGDAVPALSGERYDTVLDLVGWPNSLRDVAAGVTTLVADLLDGTPRDALQTIETAEAGWGYQDRDGTMVFRDRHADRGVTRMAVSQATFSDANATKPYNSLVYSYDRKYIYNVVERSRTDGAPQVVSDETSAGRYFRRKHSVPDLPLVNDIQARALADKFVHLFAFPRQRPEPLVVDPGNNPAELYPDVLGRRLLDRITLRRTPQEIGDPILDDYRIEGVTTTIGQFTWETVWNFSPVDDTTYWTLDDDALGLLDAGNLVGA